LNDEGKTNSDRIHKTPEGDAVDDELRKIQRYFKSDGNGQSKEDYFIGVRMGSLFGLAKEYVDMPVGEIEKLMESPIHEVRAGR
jgi:hypothetical protein